jgi:hypothetical protein
VINWLAIHGTGAAEGEGEASNLFSVPSRLVQLSTSPATSATVLSLSPSPLDNSPYVSASTPKAAENGPQIVSLPDEEEDLLEALATDIAPLWNEIS